LDANNLSGVNSDAGACMITKEIMNLIQTLEQEEIARLGKTIP